MSAVHLNRSVVNFFIVKPYLDRALILGLKSRWRNPEVCGGPERKHL